jgi:hypothetical protein
LLETSAAHAQLPLEVFVEGVRHYCGPDERRELDRLLALAELEIEGMAA